MTMLSLTISRGMWVKILHLFTGVYIYQNRMVMGRKKTKKKTKNGEKKKIRKE